MSDILERIRNPRPRERGRISNRRVAFWACGISIVVLWFTGDIQAAHAYAAAAWVLIGLRDW